MLKKLIKRKLKLFFIFFLISFFSLLIKAETDILKSKNLNFLDLESQNIFIYQGEASYGKLNKQKISIYWPILNKQSLYKRLLKKLKKQDNVKKLF